LADVLPLIAIIDDDEIAREATLSLVASLGYQTATFASAEEFLQSEQVHDVACIVSDLHMPGLSGIDLQDRLIAHGYHIPIIFITGHPDDGARARAMKAGAVGFMSKPYNVELLVGCLREASKAF
jgi:FixJ family two-component response regulator